VSPDDLPRLGVISNTSQDVLGRFAEWLSVKDRRVLCVGYAEHELERLVEPYRPAEIVCLTNWADHRDAQIARHRVVIGDLCGRTKLQDASFDAVLLFSVLEHLHDVDAALVELQRLLTPRGHVALLFGPAWSCAYGHHLYADPDDPNLNFVRWTLPAHMHLLCERDEIRAWYRRQGYADAVVESVLHWFYETPIINRLFYEDHVAALGRHFQIVASEIMYNDLPRAHLAALRARYPGYTDFSSYGGKFLLRAAG
jgi:SAM-dependent methyltransferase